MAFHCDPSHAQISSPTQGQLVSGLLPCEPSAHFPRSHVFTMSQCFPSGRALGLLDLGIYA